MSTTDRRLGRGEVDMPLAPPDAAPPAGVETPAVSVRRYGPKLGHAITIAALAALAAGLMVGGIGSRLAMRLVAVLGDPADVGRLTEAQARVGDITLEGTAFVLVAVTVISTVVGAIAYVAVGPVLRGRPLARGLEFGAILLLALGSQVIQAENFDFAQFATPAVTIGLFAALFVLFGIVTVLVAAWLERWLPVPGARRSGDAGYWAALLIGAAAVLLMVVSAVGSRADLVAIVAIIVVVSYAALVRATHAGWVTALGWVIIAVGVLPLGVALMGEVLEIIGDATTPNAIQSIGAETASQALLIAAVGGASRPASGCRADRVFHRTRHGGRVAAQTSADRVEDGSLRQGSAGSQQGIEESVADY